VSIKLLVITSESPFPPNRGGRVDQWERFKLFKDHGCQLMLVSWYVRPADKPSATESTSLNGLFDKIHLFPIDQTLWGFFRRLILLPKYSPHISSRKLSASEWNVVLSTARSFAPDAIWLDSLYGGVIAVNLARDFGVPLFYRSHNIEFQYMRSQADQALSLRDKAAWALACINLKSFEISIQRNSQCVFDISCDDITFWRSMGITHNIWAPPLFASDPTTKSALIPYARRPFDIVFLGSLFAPNNVRGIEWFVEEALPIVRRSRPAIKVRIAGSQPNTMIRRLMACNPEINLLEEPADANAIWREGRILVNPILTGSGMNVKSAEMLFYDAHLVTSPMGVRGFPSDMRAEFHVADTAESFAKVIVGLLDTPYELASGRRSARHRLGPAGIDPIIKAINNRVLPAKDSKFEISSGRLNIRD
jgi:hypothetical protein